MLNRSDVLGSSQLSFAGKRIKLLAAPLMVAAVCAMTTPYASAGASYLANGRLSDGYTVFDQYYSASGNAISDSRVDPGYGSIYINAASSADISGLHASASASINFNNGVAQRVERNADASATGTYNDFVVKGSGTGPVTTSLNFSLGGSVLGSGKSDADAYVFGGSAGVTLIVQIFNTSESSWQTVGTGLYSYGASAYEGGSGITQTGMLSHWQGLGTVTTDDFTVTPNTPFTVRIMMTASATFIADMTKFVAIDMSSDFSHTLTFNTTGDVMNLPTGYTVDSADAGVTGNTFVAVPEPASISALALTAGFALLRRRKQK